MTTGSEPETSTASRPWLSWVLLAWAAGVVVLFGLQAATYSGLYRGASEWQLNQFGTYYPGVTLSVLIAVFGAPVLYLFSPNATRNAAAPDDARAPAIRFLAALGGIAAVLAIGAIAVALYPTLSAIGERREPVTIKVAGAAEHSPGPAVLEGRQLNQASARNTLWALWNRSSAQYVPVVSAEPGSDQRTIRYFVESTSSKPLPQSVKGNLKRGALAPDALRVFQNQGFTVADPHFVLYTDANAFSASYYGLALRFAVAALIVGLAALVQASRLRKLPSGRRRGQAHAVG